MRRAYIYRVDALLGQLARVASHFLAMRRFEAFLIDVICFSTSACFGALDMRYAEKANSILMADSTSMAARLPLAASMAALIDVDLLSGSFPASALRYWFQVSS